MKNEVFNKFELALYDIMIFLILREWLLPIMMLTGMGYVELILLFIILCLLFSLFRIPFFYIVGCKNMLYFMVYRLCVQRFFLVLIGRYPVSVQ